MTIPTLISTNTVSSAAASTEFTSGIDSTYDEYMFVFINIKNATALAEFQFDVSLNGGTDYETVDKCSFFHNTIHEDVDDGHEAGPNYATAPALTPVQGAVAQEMSVTQTEKADKTLEGILHLFGPSNTTYVKHYEGQTHHVHTDGSNTQFFSMTHGFGGYLNTTTAVNAIKFSFNDGNITSGIIQMYGIA